MACGGMSMTMNDSVNDAIDNEVFNIYLTASEVPAALQGGALVVADCLCLGCRGWPGETHIQGFVGSQRILAVYPASNVAIVAYLTGRSESRAYAVDWSSLAGSQFEDMEEYYESCLLANANFSWRPVAPVFADLDKAPPEPDVDLRRLITGRKDAISDEFINNLECGDCEDELFADGTFGHNLQSVFNESVLEWLESPGLEGVSADSINRRLADAWDLYTCMRRELSAARILAMTKCVIFRVEPMPDLLSPDGSKIQSNSRA